MQKKVSKFQSQAPKISPDRLMWKFIVANFHAFECHTSSRQEAIIACGEAAREYRASLGPLE